MRRLIGVKLGESFTWPLLLSAPTLLHQESGRFLVMARPNYSVLDAQINHGVQTWLVVRGPYFGPGFPDLRARAAGSTARSPFALARLRSPNFRS
jgi:hypothetical protein